MDTDKIIFHSERKENYFRSDWEYMYEYLNWNIDLFRFISIIHKTRTKDLKHIFIYFI